MFEANEGDFNKETQSIGSKVEELQELYQTIKTDIEAGNMINAGENIDVLSQLIQSASFYSIKGNYLYQLGELQQAYHTFKQGLEKFPFHGDLNFNFAVICQLIGEYDNSLTHYAKAIKYMLTKDQEAQAFASLSQLAEFLTIQKIMNTKTLQGKIKECEQLIAEGDSRSFPIDSFGNSVVRKVNAKETDEQYLVNMYKAIGVMDIDEDTRVLFKTEMYKGQECKRNLELTLDAPSIVPTSLIHEHTALEFRLNDKAYTFKPDDLDVNKYHYLFFDEPGVLKVKSNKSTFIGNPIVVKDEPKSPRLVLNIFIDGLSQKYIEQHGLEAIMPNTAAFFKNGFMSSNCYATSEWTLPSMASIFTGKYSTNHRLYHPDYNYSLEKSSKLMQEYFKEAGYFTTQISNNWRITPTYGYYKGFDRIIYKNLYGEFDCGNVITETLEHLEAFKHKNNFVWMSFGDLHHVPDKIDCNILSQVQIPIHYHQNSNKKGATTVLTDYDETMIVKYKLEIQRIDMYLEILYQYLLSNFQDDSIVVTLYSDHGQSFLEDVDTFFHESRQKVPFMMMGGKVPNMNSNEIMETVDILPSLLHVSGIKHSSTIDGRLPMALGGSNERAFAFTESIHPDQTYKAAIIDDVHLFSFETKNNVDTEGSVDLGQYQSKLIHRTSNDNEAHMYANKVLNYENIVYEHIKDFIKIDKD